MISLISTSLAEQHGLDLPKSKRLLEEVAGRGLAGGGKGTSDFCTGDLTSYQQQSCDDYHAEFRATVIFTVAVSSALLAVIFFCVGRFNLTRYASYVPICVMEAFLSCVGYKVFKYALKFCHYSPRQFIPAACIGVPLYFIKAYHIGNPAVMIPVMLIVPLGIFYAVVYGAGSSIQDQEEWMFPKMDNIEFWRLWTDSIGSFGSINMRAWLTTLPELAIMLIVCFMDCVLKILGTEGKLPVKVDKNYEMKLLGLGNLLATVCGSPVGYMQLKFNVINYGIVGNAKDNRGGLFYAVLCCATFFTTVGHFNYLPRFFLGIMLFFAGAGFVAENLWGSRVYLAFREWLQIFAILAVFIIFEKLLYAVMTGVILTCIDFVLTYAKVRCVAGKPTQGNETSVVRRHPLMQANVVHISNNYLHVVRLKGFVFFASAQYLFVELREMFESQVRESVPAYRRLRFVIFDCALLDGMDSSTKRSLRKLAKDARAQHIKIYWSHVKQDFADQLKAQEIIHSDQQWYSCLDEAIQSIEERLVRYREQVQEWWVNLHPVFQAQQKMTTAHNAFEPFKDVFLTNAARCGIVWQYCQPIAIQKFTSLLWEPGQLDVPLYMVHRGSVALFRELPDSGAAWAHPVAVYQQGWFLNRERLIGDPTRYYAVAMEDGELVSWTAEQLTRMGHERPQMFSSMQRAAMKQQAKDCDLKDQQFDQTSLYTEGEWMQGEANGRRPYLPEQVSTRLKGMQLAEVFGSLGFFDHTEHEDSVLPQLPSSLRRDLEVAFSVFSEAPMKETPTSLLSKISSEGDEKDDRTAFDRMPQPCTISWDQAGRALLYAGVFNVGLNRLGCSSLTKEQFLALGHEAAMIRLSKKKTAELIETFQARASSSDEFARLPYSNLFVLLQDILGSEVALEELELLSLKGEWQDSCSNGMDSNRFLAAVSRLLRLHHHDWTLLRAIRHMTGKQHFGEGCTLDASELVDSSVTPLTQLHAEEMLWISDWRTGGQGRGKTIEFCDLVAALVMPIRGPVGKLPPRPSGKALGLASGSAVEFLGDLSFESETCSRDSDTEILVADFQGAPESSNLGIAHITDLLINLNSDSPEAADPWLRSVSEEMDRRLSYIDFDADEVSSEPGQTEESLPPGCHMQMYLFLEEPGSSTAATIFWLGMGILILLSVLTMVLESLLESRDTQNAKVWFYLDASFTGLFTLEYLLRFSVANAFGASRLQFIAAPANVCDLLAILPLYIDLALNSAAEEFRLLRLVRLLRLARISRIARLAKKVPIFGPIAMVLVVIWFIFMKTESDKRG
eukprot:TRINITY_DN19351_c0_g1_i1.p1 TRINITY_DN19351_c0_g1~~TRINITY_DN19351_c0_g1_i1.p1  ORF type:complete len:1295 (-),score=236.00 TRINITY_DN19351_c0_g1_i1:83-3967(-)